MNNQKGLFSVVIPTLNEGDMLHMTVDNILTQTAYPDYEIVVVDDGSTDNSCDVYKDHDSRIRVIHSDNLGVARARNFGADNCDGEYICFIDAHCKVSGNWLDSFVQTLNMPAVAMVGPSFTKLFEPKPRGCGMGWINTLLETTWYYPLETQNAYEVPLTPGGCQAFRKDIFNATGRYEDGFSRWGFEDVEFCLRLWLLGYRIMVNPSIIVAHHFRSSRNFDVYDYDILYNLLRMIHMHFSPQRIRTVLKTISNYPDLERAMDDLYATDIMELREELYMSRVHDDDWFFNMFGPDTMRLTSATRA